RLCGGLFILFGLLSMTAFAQDNGVPRATPTARSADEFKEAQALGQITDPQKLLVFAQQFLIKYPDSEIRPIANRYIVSSFIQVKDYPQAVANAERALKERPDNLT